jgi:hypothetical protein
LLARTAAAAGWAVFAVVLLHNHACDVSTFVLPPAVDSVTGQPCVLHELEGGQELMPEDYCDHVKTGAKYTTI